MPVTETKDKEYPPAPEGWRYWYTMYWTVNRVHMLRTNDTAKLYINEEGNICGSLGPKSSMLVNTDELPAKLFVYRPVKHDKNSPPATA